MLQQPEPDDYVIATGETHTVREFLDEVGSYLGVDWERHVVIEPRYFRPAEVDALLGDYAKARRVLGWEPRVTFRALARLMADHDLALAEREAGRRDDYAAGGRRAPAGADRR
jgi:GDPmannose 4,6-dehydratase